VGTSIPVDRYTIMDREIRLIRLAAMAAAILAPAIAAAQAPSSSTSQAAPATEHHGDPISCAQAPTTVGAGGDLKVEKPADGTLSDQLASSDGVICPPPNVDPQINAPTPQGGTMPVIPPPGSPGGDPTVHPK
jgi:hypothetical protein